MFNSFISSSKMTKFIRNISLISIVVLILYAPVYCALAYLKLVCPKPTVLESPCLTELKFNEINNYHNIDILFVGPSLAYRSFDVRRFRENGFEVFNMGTTSQTPVQNYILLKHFLDQLQPRFVVIAVQPPQSKPIESTLDFICSDFEDNKVQWECMKLHMVILCKSWNIINSYIYNCFLHYIYLPIRSYIKHIPLNVNHIDGEETIIGIDKYIRGGYVERQENLTCSLMEYKSKKILFNSMQIKYLMRSIDLVQSRNIPFLLVEVPIQTARYQAWQNHEEWEQLLTDYPYVNYNGRISLNDTTEFYDSNHMNKYGVAKFDSLFIADFKEYFMNSFAD